MFMVNLRWMFQDDRWGEEDDDVCTHFDTMHMMHEDLAAMGGSIT